MMTSGSQDRGHKQAASGCRTSSWHVNATIPDPRIAPWYPAEGIQERESLWNKQVVWSWRRMQHRKKQGQSQAHGEGGHSEQVFKIWV